MNEKYENKIANFLLKILLTLVIVFVTLQLYVLTSVGTQGQKLNSIKETQKQLKTDNELKKAQIMELQSTSSISTILESKNLTEIKVNYIDASDSEVSALK